MSLFEELKRRNVIRVGIAYVVTAWAVSQIAELATDSFEAPAWVIKIFIIFLGLGFPLALIFAWAFELTPEGLKKEKDVDRTKSITSHTGRKLDRTIIVMLVLILAWFTWDKFISQPARVLPANTASQTVTDELQTPDQSTRDVSGGTDEPQPKSIAVLPFINRSAGQENTRFFSDGIHDDLLTILSKIQDLKVISRTSSMAYRDTMKNMRQIGEELGVANLLEGGVQQSGERVRINVQLIHAQTDEHLWAETYDREITAESIFEIQGEIARAIASALQATLSTDEDKALGDAPTQNLVAYQAVLMSRQLEQSGSFEALAGAVDHAQKAIKQDPNYADAYIALARALTVSIMSGSVTDKEVGVQIRAAIDKAMTLDGESGTAWTELARYQFATDNPDAESSFETAMRLQPGNADTLYAYGYSLQIAGQPLRAMPLLLQSRELDPLSQKVLFVLGRLYESLGDYEKARNFYARIREIDPSSPYGYGPTGGTYYATGQLDLALYWLNRSIQVDPTDFELSSWMVLLYDNLEVHDRAQAWLDWQSTWVSDQPVPMAMQARHHYVTGNFESALELSNRALALGLSNRWGSDGLFMRIKRDEALKLGELDQGVTVLSTQHPELTGDVPAITPANILQALDLAQMLGESGRNADSRKLLEAVIKTYELPYFTNSGRHAQLVPAKAQALALLGDGPAALAELRRIIDRGWRLNWRWETEFNINFKTISETPEFEAMVSELRADIAVQRTHVHEMLANGEIAPPPAIPSN